MGRREVLSSYRPRIHGLAAGPTREVNYHVYLIERSASIIGHAIMALRPVLHEKLTIVSALWSAAIILLSFFLSAAEAFDRILLSFPTALPISLEIGLRETPDFFLAMYSSSPTNISEARPNAKASSSQIENVLGGRSLTNAPCCVKIYCGVLGAEEASRALGEGPRSGVSGTPIRSNSFSNPRSPRKNANCGWTARFTSLPLRSS